MSLPGGTGSEIIAIIVPSLNPDHAIVDLVCGLRKTCKNPIIAVDDGSTEPARVLFDELEQIENVEVLRHNVNLGKGRALKTAFNHFLNRYGDNGIGCVTVDGDGQHAIPDIMKCVEELSMHPDRLVLGVRDFSLPGIPFKSRFGNNLTKWIFRVMVNCRVSDTQTGLRGIGRNFMKILMNTPGERFEFETEMLLAAKRRKVSFDEVPIDTIYLDQNRATHFDPITDSIRIYGVIFRRGVLQLFGFSLSGVISLLIDTGLFMLFMSVLPLKAAILVPSSQTLARIISATCNYLMNRNLVFATKGGLFDRKSFLQYAVLCVVVLLSSIALVWLGRWLIPSARPGSATLLIVKLTADAICFFLSFFVQKMKIFSQE
ncbi:MAG: glycosyltransferase [Victivallaceae bacterium]|nr:bifunctional glycosyltransferase family 2/GtrA family protein [Victivallaceae bacterium]